jgi:hypothetical protein
MPFTDNSIFRLSVLVNFSPSDNSENPFVDRNFINDNITSEFLENKNRNKRSNYNINNPPLLLPSTWQHNIQLISNDSKIDIFYLDLWYFNMKGPGTGGIDVDGENAISGLLG